MTIAVILMGISLVLCWVHFHGRVSKLERQFNVDEGEGTTTFSNIEMKVNNPEEQKAALAEWSKACAKE